MIDCIKREAKEELDIDIKDCKIVHISHRIAPNRAYFDFYAKVISYDGELKINEPQKCSELKFIDINNISDKEKDLFSYDLDIIKKIEN
jgi:ADP-ribose pyrophosphatase YjhB (NUDIX family)